MALPGEYSCLTCTGLHPTCLQEVLPGHASPSKGPILLQEHNGESPPGLLQSTWLWNVLCCLVVYSNAISMCGGVQWGRGNEHQSNAKDCHNNVPVGVSKEQPPYTFEFYTASVATGRQFESGNEFLNLWPRIQILRLNDEV